MMEDNMMAFLYLLMRDHMSVGNLNEVLKQVLKVEGEFRFTDDVLRVKAESMVAQLIRDEYLVPEIDASWEVVGEAPASVCIEDNRAVDGVVVCGLEEREG